MRWRARLKAVECPERTKRRRYTTSTEIFWSAISLCKLTYLNLYSLALITLTSLFTERNDAECFLLSPLSNTKLDRLQIKDQRGRFHYQAISLLYHTNNLLKLSAIIFSPFRRRHRVLASEMTVILSSCLFVCVNVCACVCVNVCVSLGGGYFPKPEHQASFCPLACHRWLHSGVAHTLQISLKSERWGEGFHL